MLKKCTCLAVLLCIAALMLAACNATNAPTEAPTTEATEAVVHSGMDNEYLRCVNEKIVPLMSQYHIAVLYVDTARGMLVVEVYHECDDLEGLEDMLSRYIDLAYVDLIVWPEGQTIELT